MYMYIYICIYVGIYINIHIYIYIYISLFSCSAKMYGRQENLMTYNFDFATPYITRTQYRNEQKAISSPSLRLVASESPRTTEAYLLYL